MNETVDQIVKNEAGSASGKAGGIEFDEATETSLQTKVDEHNTDMSDRNRPSWTRVRLGALKSVYRRGAGAWSTSHRAGIGRSQWAMARVNAFLFLAKTGAPNNPKYITDNDLLDPDHPRYSKEEKKAAVDKQINEPDNIAEALPQAEQIALKMLRKSLEGKISAADMSFVESEIVAAGGIRQVTGHAGELIRRFSAAVKAAAMKTEDGVQYPANAFAYVPDPEMPSTWKLRLWDDPTQKETRRQIGMAVAALGVGYRGNKVQIPAEDRAAVVARVATAWKKVNPDLDPADMPAALR